MSSDNCSITDYQNEGGDFSQYPTKTKCTGNQVQAQLDPLIYSWHIQLSPPGVQAVK